MRRCWKSILLLEMNSTGRQNSNDSAYLEDGTVGVSDQSRLVVDFSDSHGQSFNSIEENGAVHRRGNASRTNPFTVENNHTDFRVSNSVADHIGGGYDFSQHCHLQLSAPTAANRSALTTLLIVTILTILFIAGEVTGGAISGSLAIMTDAAHMFSDLASYLISIFAILIARKPATRKMSFGFYRAEVLGAVCSIMVIWVLTGILVYLAVLRVIDTNFSLDADPMLITAAAGVAFNIIMAMILHLCGHGHSHGGQEESFAGESAFASQSFEERSVQSMHNSSVERRGFSLTAYPSEDVNWAVNKQRNINVRAAFIHVVGDLVQSMGVLIAALVYKYTGKKIADPICTFIFSVLVIITTLTVLRDVLHVLMEGTPKDVDYNQVKLDLQQVDGVKTAHSLHMWSLTMDKAALAVHLAIDRSSDALTVMHKASRMMRYKYNLAFTTIQVEPYDADIMDSCVHCVGPS